MTELHWLPERAQDNMATLPYDRWVSPAGALLAEFHRGEEGFLVRFPRSADFAISPDTGMVRCAPAPGADMDHVANLYRNAIIPIIGNHLGGLFLHGSAVAIDGRAVAFLGLSRSGKTTLAAALAKAGHPLLTEDVIELIASPAGYMLQPKDASLRLFADSAAYVLGTPAPDQAVMSKRSIPLDAGIAFASAPAPLAQIYLLGNEHDAALSVTPLSAAAALKEMLHHAFLLDVEDKMRLNAHFCRIAELCEAIPCSVLDYPRQYSELPAVLNAIIDGSRASGGQ